MITDYNRMMLNRVRAGFGDDCPTPDQADAAFAKDARIADVRNLGPFRIYGSASASARDTERRGGRVVVLLNTETNGEYELHREPNGYINCFRAV